MAELQRNDPVAEALIIEIIIMQGFTAMGLSYILEAGQKTSIHLLMLRF